jgi:ParB-like chromosome segregation protein Spo0J
MKTITANGRTFTCPFADALPVLKPEERAALKALIQEQGILDPIKVDEEDNVLDGHNRLEIAVELELKDIPTKLVAGLTDAQKRDLAEDLNLHRRHLKREEINKVLARRVKANPELSDRAIAGSVGVDHKTVAPVRASLERSGEIPHIATRTDRKGRKRPGTQPARPKALATEPQLNLFQPPEETPARGPAVTQESPTPVEPDKAAATDEAKEPSAPSPVVSTPTGASPKRRPIPWTRFLDGFANRSKIFATDARSLRKRKIAERNLDDFRKLIADVRRWADESERWADESAAALKAKL